MHVEEGIPQAPSGSSTVSTDNPWPGLLAFREADQGYFQGRKAETEELFRLVMRERLSVLFGLSGLGKSSLLQAGLFPLLRRETVLPIYIRLDFSDPEPDLVGQVKADIAREASAVHIEAPPARAGDTLWEYFHRQDNNFWTARNQPVTPLLVFDQFEEIFTLGRADPSRTRATEALIEQVADLVEGRPPARLKARLDEHPEETKEFLFSHHDYKILLSIREDFLPDLEALRTRMPALSLNRFRLKRMNGEAAVLVVNQARHLIDPDVAEQVVRFVAADQRRLPLADLEVEPALLSVVCRELNNKRRALGVPKITASLLEGSHAQVLEGVYESSVADLPIEVRRFVEDRLLTVSGYRDSVALDNALSAPGVTRESIARLVDRRLVRREDRGGVQRLELTHDLLCGVVRASRDHRLQLEAVENERRALLEAQEREKLRLEAENERLALLEAQEREKRQRDRQYLRRARVAAALFLILTIAAVAAAIWAVKLRTASENARYIAERARSEADNTRLDAEHQRKRAESAVEMIQRNLLIRQAALSGNKVSLATLLSSLDQNTIRFTARATDLGFRNPSNQQVYKFDLFPEPGTLPAGKDAVAFVTYLADHPNFQNTLLTAGSERGFRASYTGWGCLNRIVALVEYKDPTRPPTVAEFNMCNALSW